METENGQLLTIIEKTSSITSIRVGSRPNAIHTRNNYKTRQRRILLHLPWSSLRMVRPDGSVMTSSRESLHLSPTDFRSKGCIGGDSSMWSLCTCNRYMRAMHL